MRKKASQPLPQEQEQLHTLQINGRCPNQYVTRRILTAPATPVGKDDIATKPIGIMSRGFNLMR